MSKNKKTRIAKGLGAGALAVATLASGLSFGAASANAVPSGAAPFYFTADESTASGYPDPYGSLPEMSSRGQIYSINTDSRGGPVLLNTHSSLANAEQSALKMEYRGGKLMFGSTCLVAVPNSTSSAGVYPKPALQSCTDSKYDPGVKFRADGRIIMNAFGRNIPLAYGYRYGGLTYLMLNVSGKATAGGQFAPKNGGVVAAAGGVTRLDRDGAVEVPFGTKATAKYTEARHTVTLTAPAGTSFAAGQSTVAGGWSSNGSTFTREAELGLTNVQVTGRTLTGTFDSSRSSGFSQDKDYQLRWYPKLTVDRDAASGDRNMAFDITGTTNLGATAVNGNTAVVVPEADGIPAPTADVLFGDDVRERARVAGVAQDGATVTVRNAAGDVVGNPQVVDGRFSLPVNSPGAGVHEFTVTQTIDGETSEPITVSGDFGAAVAVTALPAQVTPGDQTISGTGENGRTVTVQVGSETKTAVVANGRWSVVFELRPSNTAAQVSVSQTAQGNTVTTGSTSTTANMPIAARAVTIDEPSSHEYTPMEQTTLSGTATPYATVKIETTRGGLIREVQADKNGNWSFSRAYGPSNVYMLVATQTRVDGTTSRSAEFVMSPVGAFRALTVTSHTDGGTYTPGTNTFRGTATPDAMIKVTNQWDREVATVQASSVSGAWEVEGRLGPTADYTLTFTQTAPNGQKDMVTMDLSSDMPAYEDAVLTSPTNNSTYRPGSVTFTGTGSEGTEIVAKNQWGTLMGSAKVGADGTWEFDRDLGPTADYVITFVATRGSDTNTFTVNVNSPKAAPLVITSHAVGDTYTPNERVTFTGTASPFAEIDVKTKRGGQVATATANDKGEWSFSRAFGPTNVYEMVFTQTDVYGKDQAGAEFTFAPNPAK